MQSSVDSALFLIGLKEYFSFYLRRKESVSSRAYKNVHTQCLAFSDQACCRQGQLTENQEKNNMDSRKRPWVILTLELADMDLKLL